MDTRSRFEREGLKDASVPLNSRRRCRFRDDRAEKGEFISVLGGESVSTSIIHARPRANSQFEARVGPREAVRDAFSQIKLALITRWPTNYTGDRVKEGNAHRACETRNLRRFIIIAERRPGEVHYAEELSTVNKSINETRN